MAKLGIHNWAIKLSNQYIMNRELIIMMVPVVPTDQKCIQRKAPLNHFAHWLMLIANFKKNVEGKTKTSNSSFFS